MVEPFAPYNDPFLEGKDMSFDNLDNVPLKVDCVLSSFDMKIGDLKSLNTGSRLPLHNDSLSNIKIYVNNNLVALGKVIDIDGTYALQIKELINNSELLEKHMAEQFNQHSAPANNKEFFLRSLFNAGNSNQSTANHGNHDGNGIVTHISYLGNFLYQDHCGCFYCQKCSRYPADTTKYGAYWIGGNFIRLYHGSCRCQRI